MKNLKAPAVPPIPRQLSLPLEVKPEVKMSVTDWSKAKLVLAQILMQAAGLIVEEFDDDER